MFVARHMGVAVQKDINLRRRLRRRNVHQVKAHAVPLQIDRQRPFADHCRNCRARSSPAVRFASTPRAAWRANIAEMPDFIRVLGQASSRRRQMIVRVGQDKDAQRYAILILRVHSCCVS